MSCLTSLLGSSKHKLRPLMIILAAVALALIFLGCVLTIVGHWPGYESWGDNPLKYVGPALLGLGVIILVGVIVDCCVRAERDEADDDYEKKEFVDLNSKSDANTPTVVVKDQHEANLGQLPPGSAFKPYTAENDYGQDVNVLKMLKNSPTHDKKYHSNYNTGNNVKVPTPSYPSDAAKKSVGYNSYTYSSDGDKMKLTEDQKLKSSAPYRQQPLKAVPPEGPRRWGSSEKILGDSNGNKTPPRSPKTKKNNGNPNQGVYLQKAQPTENTDKNKPPALHMPAIGRRSRSKNRQDSRENSAPSSPTKTRKSDQYDLEEPDLEVKRTLIVPIKQGQGQEQSHHWGSHSKGKETDLSPVNGSRMSKERQGPTESTPREGVIHNRTEYSGSSRDHSREFSDPQGHTSRRERDRQSRSRQHGHSSRSRERGDGRRDRSSSGHRRHRSRSRDRARTRDDVYSATSIDYVTGAPIKKPGRSRSQERDQARYGSSGSRRSRSHDRNLNKSYDSDEPYHRRHYRYPHDYTSSHSGSRDQQYRDGIINVAYDRDASSDDSHGMSPRHRSHQLNHSNSTAASADNILKNGQLALSPSNRKQTMNFTINVNAQPGSAVQIAMGNQRLPPAKPMLPPNTSFNLTGQGQTSEIMMTQLPHDSSIESSSSRSRVIRT